MLITTASALETLARELKSLGRFALDTEFIREKTYRPQLCLVQIAAGEKAVLVDPFLTPDLTPILDLIFDPEVVKVVHAGEQDMEIFYSMGRKAPRSVFDTQVAAAMAGRGESISYARLVEDLTGVRLSKIETFTDWSKRPLRPEQLVYALDDVRYLHRVVALLEAELQGLGRGDWLRDELAFYEDIGTYEKDPDRLYLKVRSASKLDSRELAVLRNLAAWREEEAQKMDRPRGRIILDEVLVELARRAPASLEQIGAVRGIHPQLIRRSGQEILRRVAAAKKLKPEEYPPPIERRASDAELSLVVDLLEVVLRARAAEAKIAPAYLASRKDLSDLAVSVLQGGKDSAREALPLLSGWRRRLAGEALLELLNGDSHVAINARKAKVEVVGRDSGSSTG